MKRCKVFLKTNRTVIYPSKWFILDFLKFWWLDVSLPDDNAYDGWKDYQPICRERESFSKMWSRTNGTMMCDSGELLVVGYPSSEMYPNFGDFCFCCLKDFVFFWDWSNGTCDSGEFLSPADKLTHGLFQKVDKLEEKSTNWGTDWLAASSGCSNQTPRIHKICSCSCSCPMLWCKY